MRLLSHLRRRAVQQDPATLPSELQPRGALRAAVGEMQRQLADWGTLPNGLVTWDRDPSGEINWTLGGEPVTVEDRSLNDRTSEQEQEATDRLLTGEPLSASAAQVTADEPSTYLGSDEKTVDLSPDRPDLSGPER